jgi:hypothetical protein
VSAIFEQGVINSLPPPPELVLEAALKKPSAENVGKPKYVGKRKTSADLLELIPSTSPIPQAELFEAARAAGINQKYARQFLSGLIAEKRIVVQKIPQEKKKSALGFIRAPAQPESRDAAEELF